MSFSPLQSRPWQISPVFNSLDFVKKVFIRGGVSLLSGLLILTKHDFIERVVDQILCVKCGCSHSYYRES